MISVATVTSNRRHTLKDIMRFIIQTRVIHMNRATGCLAPDMADELMDGARCIGFEMTSISSERRP